MRKLTKRKLPAFVICLERGSYRIDLQIGKIYRTAAREDNDPPQMARIIDDSGEDYLYPSDWFMPVELPTKVKRRLAEVRLA